MATFRHLEGGGVTAPLGFRAGAAACGIKSPGSDKLDLMILHTPHPTVAAATFTSNRVQAAPVRVTREHLAQDEIRAVIVNSGNANACNGEQGLADAREMAALAAAKFALRPSQVAVGSTGVIGKPLPMDRIRSRIDEAAQLGDDPLRPTLAIMTSDTVPKYCAVEMPIAGKTVRLGAMTKGAGMICPNMATMLCYVTTDAAIDRATLQTLTRRAVEYLFNRITIEGDMSTNDTVLVLANGQAGNPPIESTDSVEAATFYEALHHVLLRLAKEMVRDAEKATRFIELEVRGARSEADAHTVAKTVANSVLVKCMWNGGQPYWGRIMHAIGYAGVDISEEKIAIDFNALPAARGGTSAGTPVDVLRAETDQPEHRVLIDLGLGDGTATIYTSDLSENFVEFNLLD